MGRLALEALGKARADGTAGGGGHRLSRGAAGQPAGDRLAFRQHEHPCVIAVDPLSRQVPTPFGGLSVAVQALARSQ